MRLIYYPFRALVSKRYEILANWRYSTRELAKDLIKNQKTCKIAPLSKNHTQTAKSIYFLP